LKKILSMRRRTVQLLAIGSNTGILPTASYIVTIRPRGN
jgi:hypothetical protein